MINEIILLNGETRFLNKYFKFNALTFLILIVNAVQENKNIKKKGGKKKAPAMQNAVTCLRVQNIQ